MRNRYRIIYYAPDYKHGSRFAIGVIAETPTGVSYIPSLRWPPPVSFSLAKSHRSKMEILWAKLKGNKIGIPMDMIPFTNRLKKSGVRHYPAAEHSSLKKYFQLKILPR